jgi:hypothetical protein
MQSLNQVDFCHAKTWQLDSIDADKVNHLVRNWWGENENNFFPGPQPVSIERKDISLLKTNDYRVCEKTDGERFLFVCVKYMNQSLAVLINRKQEVFLLPIVGGNDIFAGTLLDGELVKTKSSRTYKYIVYDCVRAFGESVISNTHTERLQSGISVVAQIQNTKQALFKICVKQFYPFARMSEYIDIVVPTLTHDIDGYIFTPNNEPIRTGTHYSMFKWKQRLHNTVDFLIKDGGVYIMKKNKIQLLSGVVVKIPPVLEEEIKMGQKKNVIFECEYVSEMTWIATRVRSDKTHPNGFFTYTKTMHNIREDIQLFEFTMGNNNNII